MRPLSYLLFIFLLFSSLGFTSCGSMLCSKGDTNQGLFFYYDPLFQTVDVGALPTMGKGDSFVKHIIVKDEGFLVVTSRHVVTQCIPENENQEAFYTLIKPCKRYKEGRVFKTVEKYIIRRYIEGKGYEEWEPGTIPKKEWQNISKLDHTFSKPPTYHYENCRWAVFGALQMLRQIIHKI